MLKKYVPGMFENTYMTTSEFFTPQIEYMRYRGIHFVQTRGMWEVKNDFMGGPFVSHSFYTPDGKDIMVLEAFVYAPRYDKRQYLRQVESLLYSWEWSKNEEKEEKTQLDLFSFSYDNEPVYDEILQTSLFTDFGISQQIIHAECPPECH